MNKSNPQAISNQSKNDILKKKNIINPKNQKRKHIKPKKIKEK